MKSTLVLGLALAASAQVDNELATSWYNPSNPSGADLVRNAGWGRHLPIPNRPTYNQWSTPKTKYDDAADDELVTLPYNPSGADLVKYAKQSQQTTYRPVAHVVRDDEADDEMMVYYTKDSRGGYHYEGGYTRRDDEVADDELVSLSGADLVKYAKQSQQTTYRPVAHVVRDDEADDEMMVYYTKDSRGGYHYEGGYTRRDDEVADDELATSWYSPSNPSGADLVRNAGWGRHLPIPNRPTYNQWSTPKTKYDDAADDELVSLSGADLVKYAKQSQQTTYRPVAHVVRDDEADDEMMVYYTKDSRGGYHYEGGYTRRDDEADDELAYLGHLIKETQTEQVQKKPEIRRNFRNFEKN